MSNSKFKTGVLIYTYNRIDDAKINVEIINSVWKKSNFFPNVVVVHSYNGKNEWYPKEYLEDYLVRLKNPGHFQGASELIDAGMRIFESKYPNLDYVVVLAADTWCVNPGYVYKILRKMNSRKLYWATCSWFSLPDKPGSIIKGPAVDYFIIDFKWATRYQMFPLKYKDFSDRYADLFYSRGEPVTLESVILSRFFRAIHREFRNDAELGPIGLSKIYVMKDREPVHTHIDENGLWIRKMYWPKMGLITHHPPDAKKEILKKLNITQGENIKKLLRSKDLTYFNKGFVSYQSGN